MVRALDSRLKRSPVRSSAVSLSGSNLGQVVHTHVPQTLTRQRRDCDLNPGRTAPESSTLTTRLPSHPSIHYDALNHSERTVVGRFVCTSVVLRVETIRTPRAEGCGMVTIRSPSCGYNTIRASVTKQYIIWCRSRGGDARRLER